jgi:CYTH domain-containing protein
MFTWFKFKKYETPKTEPEKILEQIESIMFPPLRTKVDESGKTYHIDASVDSNLYAVLVDLQEQYADDSVINTVKEIHDRVYSIRELLNKFNTLDENAEYIIVEDIETGKTSKISN